MSIVDELHRAREAYERREWVATYRALSDLDGADLRPDDFMALGTTAYLLGRRNDCVQAAQRAYQAYLDQGEPLGAVRAACALTLVLWMGGEVAVGGGWQARAERLLDEVTEDAVERGYLYDVALIGHVIKGEFAEAVAIAPKITDYGRRYRDADLLALGVHSEGRLLVYSGQVAEGLQRLDEAMVGVMAGQVSPIAAGRVYCSTIETCQDVSDLGRASEWTHALTTWCDDQPGLVAFTGQCAVHRGQLMRFHGAYPDALEELARAVERYTLAGGDPALGVREAERRIATREGVPLDGTGELLQGVGVGAVEAHQLATVDRALPGECDQPGLVVAPGGQGMGPLAGPAEVRDVLAGLDRRAVDPPGGDRRHLSGHHPDHRLVEALQPLRDLARVDQQPPLGVHAQGQEVGVAIPTPVVGDLRCDRDRLGELALDHVPDERHVVQVAALHRVFGDLVEETLGPGLPTAADRDLATHPQHQGQRAGRPHRAERLALVEVRLVGPLRCLHAVVAAAEQVRSGPQRHEVIGPQVGPVQVGERAVRRHPLAALVGFASPVKFVDDAHRASLPAGSRYRRGRRQGQIRADDARPGLPLGQSGACGHHVRALPPACRDLRRQR